jgi:hypothetical protein
MIRYAVLAAGVSLALASAGSAAPLSPSPQLKQAATSDLVQVKKWKGKKHYKHWDNWDHHRHWDHHHYRGRYWYGRRYWGRRYYYRPYYWRSWGCIQAGPVWYCP